MIKKITSCILAVIFNLQNLTLMLTLTCTYKPGVTNTVNGIQRDGGACSRSHSCSRGGTKSNCLSVLEQKWKDRLNTYRAFSFSSRDIPVIDTG